MNLDSTPPSHRKNILEKVRESVSPATRRAAETKKLIEGGGELEDIR